MRNWKTEQRHRKSREYAAAIAAQNEARRRLAGCDDGVERSPQDQQRDQQQIDPLAPTSPSERR